MTDSRRHIGRHPARSNQLRNRLFAISETLMAAAALFLNRRTSHRAVGTKNAAVAWLRLKQRFAVRAFVKILAGVSRHRFLPLMAATRAGQHGFKKHAECPGPERSSGKDRGCRPPYSAPECSPLKRSILIRLSHESPFGLSGEKDRTTSMVAPRIASSASYPLRPAAGCCVD